MAEQDGFAAAIKEAGNNNVINFEGGYFSFAFGNEIALVIYGKYYILDAGQALFNEVGALVEKSATMEELIDFWVKKSKIFTVGYWSNDFDGLSEHIKIGDN